MEQDYNEHGPAQVSDDCPGESEGMVVPDAHPEDLHSKALTPTIESHSSVRLRLIADRLFGFLSNASNETLGACLVGLGACTYFILGRVGLVAIGVVGGAFLHATWENNGHSVGNEDTKEEGLNRRRQVGIDVVSQVLEWRQTSAPAVESDREAGTRNATEISPDRDLDFEGFQPATRSALTGLTDAVVRDYVKYSFSELPLSFH